MVSKLSFKGDKPRRRHKSGHRESKATSATESEIEGWVSATSARDLQGPVVIAFSDGETPACVTTDAAGTVSISTDLDILESNQAQQPAHSIEPNNVRQVFVLSPVSFDDMDSDSGFKKFALKSSGGTYLSVDKMGKLTAKASAIGPEQTFKFIYRQDLSAWIIETAFQYLCWKPDNDKSGYSVRAGSEEIGFQETFIVRIQARFKAKRSKESEPDYVSKITSRQLEDRAGRQLTYEEVRMLKKANRDGKLNEALLDIRQKSKTDTMC